MFRHAVQDSCSYGSVRVLWNSNDREKIEDYLRFLNHAGETRFPIFACESLRKLSHFAARLDGVLTLTLEIV